MTTRGQSSFLYPLFCLITAALCAPIYASDSAKERAWAEQLKEQLIVGQPLELTAGQQTFFAIFTPAEGKLKRGGVILLHGLGAHPDWPDVISPLRKNLPETGWATLAIQLPVWPNSAKFEDYPPLFPDANPRISAAVQYLQQQGILNITLVGHSLGAAMGANFLAKKAPGNESILAFVGIGMNQAPGTAAHTPDALAKISVPTLDLYGALDLDGVLNSAKARNRAAKLANNTGYRQIEIAGADHFFRGLDATLVKRVSAWLTKTAPSMEVKTDGKP